jgi:hypothetical protein
MLDPNDESGGDAGAAMRNGPADVRPGPMAQNLYQALRRYPDVVARELAAPLPDSR